MTCVLCGKTRQRKHLCKSCLIVAKAKLKPQAYDVVLYLAHGMDVSQLDALQLFSCMRLGARILEIKKFGVSIGRKMLRNAHNTGNYAVYYIDGGE